MQRIILGNIVSLVAAGFMVASCVTRSKDRTFLYQALECGILAAATLFFFDSASGAVTLIISAVRNLLVSRRKFNRRLMWVFLFLTVAIGLPINTRGIVGLLPIIATVEYTFCSYRIQSVLATKLSILVNTLIWVVYAFLILDFSTGLTDLAVLTVDIIAIVRLTRERKAARTPPGADTP